MNENIEYEKWQDLLYKISRSYIKWFDSLDDAVQVGGIGLIMGIRTFDIQRVTIDNIDKAKIGHYSIYIKREFNSHIAKIKTQKRNNGIYNLSLDYYDFEITNEVHNDDYFDIIEEYKIKFKDDTYKDIFIKYLEGYSFDDIGKIYNMSRQAVVSRMKAIARYNPQLKKDLKNS